MKMKVVIRAGGFGTRLWPYSRTTRPKQFHRMVGERTMLQEAVDRIQPLAGVRDLHVSTGSELVALVREQLPELPGAGLIVEPALRNTGPAVGLECVLLESRYPGCTVASLGSDHHIGKPEEFCRLLRVAGEAAEEDPEALFTLGVKPTRVETGYGYIQKGSVARRINGEPVYSVARFREKPDEQTAKRYVESGDYLWNSNMFVWKARTVLALFEQFEPELHRILMRIQAAVGTGSERAVIEREYPRMAEVAIDNAIIERAPEVATLEADIEWSDIGSWGALTDILPVDSHGNLVSGEVLNLNSRDNTVYGVEGKLIALADVEGLVVVDTPDALLICRRDRAQRVRDVVAALRDGRAGYL